MPILVDFNQVLIASVSVAAGIHNAELNPDMIRHLFLNSILGYKKKFGAKYGEVVICCDGGNLWRKKGFPYYKAKRAKNRAESPLDWEMIFDTMNKLRSELDEFFPYKVVHVNGAEGDDVIAVLVKYLQTNELVQRGLEEVPEEILIVSADTDFVQLQEYPNVSQWTPMFKKMIIEHNPREYRFNKIICGDVGDGVPNIFSDDDTLVVDGKRQKPATAKKVQPILDACLNFMPIPSEHSRNFDRNKLMIDLVEYGTPQDIVDEIITTYCSANVAPRNALLGYFMKFRLNNLASSLSQF